MSKPLHTLPAFSTREAGRIWTSCDEKWIKYSVNEGGVRCANYFSANSVCIGRATSLQRSQFEAESQFAEIDINAHVTENGSSGRIRWFLPLCLGRS